MFSLCKDFEDLSLEDKTDGSSSSSSSTILAQPSSYGYRGPFLTQLDIFFLGPFY